MNSKKQIIIRSITVAVGFIFLAAILVYYAVFNPTEQHSFFPSCAFKATTGLDCVGCGIQRAIHSLLHGRIIEAIGYNALFVFLLPVLFIYVYYSLKRFVFGYGTPNIMIYKHRFGVFLIVIVLIFLIVRNLPIEAVEWLNSSK